MPSFWEFKTLTYELNTFRSQPNYFYKLSQFREYIYQSYVHLKYSKCSSFVYLHLHTYKYNNIVKIYKNIFTS